MRLVIPVGPAGDTVGDRISPPGDSASTGDPRFDDVQFQNGAGGLWSAGLIHMMVRLDGEIRSLQATGSRHNSLLNSLLDRPETTPAAGRADVAESMAIVDKAMKRFEAQLDDVQLTVSRHASLLQALLDRANSTGSAHADGARTTAVRTLIQTYAALGRLREAVGDEEQVIFAQMREIRGRLEILGVGCIDPVPRTAFDPRLHSSSPDTTPTELEGLNEQVASVNHPGWMESDGSIIHPADVRLYVYLPAEASTPAATSKSPKSRSVVPALAKAVDAHDREPLASPKTLDIGTDS